MEKKVVVERYSETQSPRINMDLTTPTSSNCARIISYSLIQPSPTTTIWSNNLIMSGSSSSVNISPQPATQFRLNSHFTRPIEESSCPPKLVYLKNANPPNSYSLVSMGNGSNVKIAKKVVYPTVSAGAFSQEEIPKKSRKQIRLARRGNESGSSKKTPIPKSGPSDEMVKTVLPIRPKSITIFRRNLLDVSSTDNSQKALSASSVTNFLEKDTVEKGLEVLDSLDPASFEVLVTKVVEVVNKRYGDYLERELRAHLGNDKYDEIALGKDSGTSTLFSAPQAQAVELGDGINQSQKRRGNKQMKKAKSKMDSKGSIGNAPKADMLLEPDKTISDNIQSYRKHGVPDDIFTFDRARIFRELPENIFESPRHSLSPPEQGGTPGEASQVDRTLKSSRKDVETEQSKNEKKEPIRTEPTFDPLLSKSDSSSPIFSSPDMLVTKNRGGGNSGIKFDDLLSPLTKTPENIDFLELTPHKREYRSASTRRILVGSEEKNVALEETVPTVADSNEQGPSLVEVPNNSCYMENQVENRTISSPNQTKKIEKVNNIEEPELMDSEAKSEDAHDLIQSSVMEQKPIEYKIEIVQTSVTDEDGAINVIKVEEANELVVVQTENIDLTSTETNEIITETVPAIEVVITDQMINERLDETSQLINEDAHINVEANVNETFINMDQDHAAEEIVEVEVDNKTVNDKNKYTNLKIIPADVTNEPGRGDVKETLLEVEEISSSKTVESDILSVIEVATKDIKEKLSDADMDIGDNVAETLIGMVSDEDPTEKDTKKNLTDDNKTFTDKTMHNYCNGEDVHMKTIQTKDVKEIADINLSEIYMVHPEKSSEPLEDDVKETIDEIPKSETSIEPEEKPQLPMNDVDKAPSINESDEKMENEEVVNELEKLLQNSEKNTDPKSIRSELTNKNDNQNREPQVKTNDCNKLITAIDKLSYQEDKTPDRSIKVIADDMEIKETTDDNKQYSKPSEEVNYNNICDNPELEQSMRDLAQLLVSFQESGRNTSTKIISNETFETFASKTPVVIKLDENDKSKQEMDKVVIETSSPKTSTPTRVTEDFKTRRLNRRKSKRRSLRGKMISSRTKGVNKTYRYLNMLLRSINTDIQSLIDAKTKLNNKIFKLNKIFGLVNQRYTVPASTSNFYNSTKKKINKSAYKKNQSSEEVVAANDPIKQIPPAVELVDTEEKSSTEQQDIRLFEDLHEGVIKVKPIRTYGKKRSTIVKTQSDSQLSLKRSSGFLFANKSEDLISLRKRAKGNIVHCFIYDKKFPFDTKSVEDSNSPTVDITGDYLEPVKLREEKKIYEQLILAKSIPSTESILKKRSAQIHVSKSVNKPENRVGKKKAKVARRRKTHNQSNKRVLASDRDKSSKKDQKSYNLRKRVSTEEVESCLPAKRVYALRGRRVTGDDRELLHEKDNFCLVIHFVLTCFLLLIW